jgi:hypothetical protein
MAKSKKKVPQKGKGLTIAFDFPEREHSTAERKKIRNWFKENHDWVAQNLKSAFIDKIQELDIDLGRCRPGKDQQPPPKTSMNDDDDD